MSRNLTRGLVGAVIASASLAVEAAPAPQGFAYVCCDTSYDWRHPVVRDAGFVNVPVVVPAGFDGHIGVDLNISDRTTGNYMPCAHGADPYYSTCEMAQPNRPDGNQYYKVQHFWANGSNDFPYGVFIENKNQDIWTGETMAHGWANRMTIVSLEFYPHSTYGMMRVDIPARYFTNYAWGGVYVTGFEMPFTLDGTVTLAGFAWDHGQGTPDFHIDVFQMSGGTQVIAPIPPDTQGPTARSFDSRRTDAAGYYGSAHIQRGRYKTYLSNIRTGEAAVLYFDLTDYGRLDFWMEKGASTCFGQAEGGPGSTCYPCTESTCTVGVP